MLVLLGDSLITFSLFLFNVSPEMIESVTLVGDVAVSPTTGTLGKTVLRVANTLKATLKSLPLR